MSIDTQTTPRVVYVGNGTATAFTVPFVFDLPEDLIVSKVLISDGSVTELIIDTDYTVAGGNYDTGFVTLTVALSALYNLVIYRDTDITQLNTFTPYDALDAVALGESLDKLTLIAQEIEDTADRVIHLSDTSVLSDLTFPEPEGSKVIAWNASGTALENADMSTAILDINSLTTATIDINGDYIPFYDTSAVGNRKTLPANIPANISGLTEDTTPDAAADYLITYDTSANVNKKVKIENLPVASLAAAPFDASYIVLSSNSELSSERILTAGSGVSFTDAGAGSTLTAALNIASLTAETSINDTTDYIPLYDDSATANRKVTTDSILKSFDISGIDTIASLDYASDYLPVHDTSTGLIKKVLVNSVNQGYKLISTTTITGTPTVIDIALPSPDYKEFYVILDNVGTTAGTADLIQLRFSNDAGATFISSAGAYYNDNTSATQINLLTAVSGTNLIITGMFRIHGTSTSSDRATVVAGRFSGVIGTSGNGVTITSASNGNVVTAGIMDAFRLFFSDASTFTTTYSTGRIYLYGIN